MKEPKAGDSVLVYAARQWLRGDTVSFTIEWLVEALANELESREGIAVAIVSSEPFMWLMAGSNHTEMQIAALRSLYAEYQKAGGKTWGKV